jgi:alanine dehydrogenase
LKGTLGPHRNEKVMRLLNRADVEQLLGLDECRKAMAEVMVELSSGRTMQPPRTVLAYHESRNSALFMPAVLTDPAVLGVKVVTIHPGNRSAAIPTHHGALILFDSRNGRPRALLEGSSITAIRTAAVSAVATHLMALPGASVLALLGSGVQARSHLRALMRVRPITEVRVWSRHERSRERFLRWAGDLDGVEIKATETAEEAVRGAEILCTVTGASRPIVEAAWVKPGAHINAVGASTITARELDGPTVAGARLVVDQRQAALSEAGDILLAISEGLMTPANIDAELGQVAAGRVPGRNDDLEVTVFKSVGLAVQDLAAAELVLRKAEAQDVGTEIEWS